METLDTPVAETMTASVRTVDGRLSVRDVSSILLTEGIGSVVVDGPESVGILTKTDVIAGLDEGVDPDATPVSTLMSAPLETVDHDATLQDAVDKMAEEGVKRLVVERDDERIGIVTSSDVVTELSPDLDRIVEMFVSD
jgi:predicted transcriptional regulator